MNVRLPEPDTVIAPVRILDAKGRLLRVVPASAFTWRMRGAVQHCPFHRKLDGCHAATGVAVAKARVKKRPRARA